MISSINTPQIVKSVGLATGQWKEQVGSRASQKFSSRVNADFFYPKRLNFRPSWNEHVSAT